MRYRRDIDGLRAIAVIAVILFHAFPTLLPGGFIGVDIFFVLSGYLISFHIINELQKNTFSFYDFYARRVRRIFPALALILIFCLVFGWYFFLSGEYQELGLHVAAGAGFAENFIYWRNINYFDVGAIQKPLLHLWSLGIEEQFYILWPCALWIAYRFNIKFLTVILSISLLSFLSNIFTLHFSSSSAAYFLPQNRFWELGIGGLCAWLETQHNTPKNAVLLKKNNLAHWIYFFLFNLKVRIKRYPDYCTGVGIALLFIGFITFSKANPFPGWWALLPTVGTALIIIAGSNAFLNRLVLSHPIFVKLGLISYPLYLWHWPLLTFAFIVDAENFSRALRASTILFSILLAWATYYFIETPIRRRSINRGTSISLCLLMTAIFLSGMTIYLFQGFTERAFPKRFQLVTEAFNDWDFPGNLTKGTTEAGEIFWRNSERAPQIAFIGDSHIEQFAPRIAQHSSWKNYSVIFVTDNGCPPIPDVLENKHTCEKFTPRIFNVLSKFPTIQTVVVGGCWNCYFILETQKIPDKNNFDYYFLKENLKYRFRDDKGAQLAMESLQSFLSTLAIKYKVFFLLDNPLGDGFDPRTLMGNRFKLIDLANVSPFITADPKQKNLNNILNNIALQAQVSVIDQQDSICPNDRCIRIDPDGAPIYKDNHHIRPFFAKNFTNYIDSILDSLVNK